MSIKITYLTKNGKKGSSPSILQGDTNNLTSGSYLFYRDDTIKQWNNDLYSLKKGDYMFYYSTNLTEFTSNLSSLTDGSYMFTHTSLTSFNNDLSSLTDGYYMFQGTSLTSFNTDLSSLTKGYYMFLNTPLKSFSGNLSNLEYGFSMFSNTPLTFFNSDLSSLVDGSGMFRYCKLNASSVKNIADTINTYNGGWITIHVDTTMSDEDKSLILSYFNTISNKGWTVDSNLSTVATVNEDGEIVESTMVCAKVDEPYDDYYTHLDNNGNKVILRTAKMVIGPRENEWTVFASLEDAEQHFALTRVDQELNKL